MSNKQETYVVKFKAHAEGLDSIIKQLSTIAAGGDIKITDKLKTDISVLQKRTQDLLQTLTGEAAKEAPSAEVLKLAFKEFQKIAEAAHNIGLDMSTMAVPAKMIEDLKKINDELAKQEEHLATLKDLKRQEESIAGPKGGATAKARAMAFEQTGGKQLDSGSDVQFESITDVKAKIKTLKTENKGRDSESDEYKKTAQAIQELENYVVRYNDKLNVLVTTAQKHKASIQGQIEEQEKLIKENPLFGHIVCRCEVVTEGEIVSAITRPLGAKDLDGVKRRTRAGMGRCQMGFCTPKVMEILARELGKNMKEITKSGRNSNVVVGEAK